MKQEDIVNLKVGDYIGMAYACPYTGWNESLRKIIRETKTRFVFENKAYILKSDLNGNLYKTEQDYNKTIKRRALELAIISKIKKYNIHIEKLEQISEILSLEISYNTRKGK